MKGAIIRGHQFARAAVQTGAKRRVNDFLSLPPVKIPELAFQHGPVEGQIYLFIILFRVCGILVGSVPFMLHQAGKSIEYGLICLQNRGVLIHPHLDQQASQ